jgi:hypothetical protein
MKSTLAICNLRRMKQFYLTLLLMLGLVAPSVRAQTTAPYYLFSGTIANPGPVNAVTVENVGNVQTANAFNDVLYDFQNMLNFINRGTFNGSPGFEFNNYNPAVEVRNPLNSFVNEQSIVGSRRILINSTNVQNNNGALLASTRSGMVGINGVTVDLEGGRVVAASDPSGGGSSTEGSLQFRDSGGNFYYINPNNIRDEYWGTTNAAITLSSISGGGVTPFHNTRGILFGQSLNVNPNSFGSSFFPTNAFFNTNGYLYFAQTNNPGFVDVDTRRVTHQLVFIRTNAFSPDIQVAFPFSTNSAGFSVYDIMVQFGISDRDSLTGQTFQRYLTLLDESMTVSFVDTGGVLGGVTQLQINDDRPGYFRPLPYTVLRSDFPNIFIGTPPSTYTNILFNTTANVNERFVSNTVNHVYAGYGFSVSPRDFGGDLGINPTLSDPTNSPGRVEINASTVNMRFATLKADNLISITATNGIDLQGATLNAPNIKLQIPGNSNIIFSNNFPDSISRLNGQIAVWTGVWRVDQRVTNTVQFPGFTGTVEHAYQVMVMDNNIVTNTPLELRDFVVQSAQVDVGDNLTFGGNLVIGGQCLHIATNGTVVLSSDNTDFNVTDAPNLKCLINDGLFSVPLLINLGTDRALGYTNIANSGVMTSGSILVRSDVFTNAGAISAYSGNLSIASASNYLNGGSLQAANNIILAGSHLSLTGATLFAGQQISLQFTNFLGDNGVTNNISVNTGIRLLNRPNKGDLMASRIISTVTDFQTQTHIWGAENRGAIASGYANNTAVQHLTLNGGVNSLFRFQGVGTNDALYVNYLEFLGGTTNTNGLHISSTLFINTNLTIYFADSNVPEDKLTNAFGGRLIWVDPSITVGPMVAVPLVSGQYVQLNTRQFQTMLAPGADFDGDGIENERDGSPMSGFTVSDVTLVNLPPLTSFVRWQATAGVTYTIEYSDSLGVGNWSVLYSITASESKELVALDVPPVGGQRFYRVRFNSAQ